MKTEDYLDGRHWHGEHCTTGRASGREMSTTEVGLRTASPRTVIAERLNRLFAAVYPPGRGPYTSAEVIRGIRRRGGDISAPYMSQLRSGARRRVSASIVAEIAEFFGIDPAYLTDNDPAYCAMLDEELTRLAASRDDFFSHLISVIVQLPVDARDEVLAFAVNRRDGADDRRD